MTIDVMITKIIRRYGFEHKATIKFCTLCETGNLPKIKKAYYKLMN